MTITGRGTVATGRVERGTLHVNDPLEIVGIKETQNTVWVPCIEMSPASCSMRLRPRQDRLPAPRISARRSFAARFLQAW